MKIEDWGLVDFPIAWQRQILLRDLLTTNQGPETLIICTHSPVVTLGKNARPDDLCGWAGPTYQIERGGKATYHGPGQIIIYPILNLSRRNFDLHLLLRQLEQVVVNVLHQYGIKAVGNPDGTQNTTGVWVKQRKIASIGLAIKKWVSYHGMAFNFQRGPNDFQGLHPCGYQSETMIYFNEIIDPLPDRQQFTRQLIEQLPLLAINRP